MNQGVFFRVFERVSYGFLRRNFNRFRVGGLHVEGAF